MLSGRVTDTPYLPAPAQCVHRAPLRAESRRRLALALGIGIEAWHRLKAPTAVDGPLLLGVAGVGLVANLATLKILHHGHEHSLNQRGAYLHVLGDLLGSVGALTAGALVLTTGWT